MKTGTARWQFDTAQKITATEKRIARMKDQRTALDARLADAERIHAALTRALQEISGATPPAATPSDPAWYASVPASFGPPEDLRPEVQELFAEYHDLPATLRARHPEWSKGEFADRLQEQRDWILFRVTGKQHANGVPVVSHTAASVALDV